MPTIGEECKHFECSLTHIDCKKEHKADGRCISGRSDCPDYEKGVLYTLEEVKEEFGLT